MTTFKTTYYTYPYSIIDHYPLRAKAALTITSLGVQTLLNQTELTTTGMAKNSICTPCHARRELRANSHRLCPIGQFKVCFKTVKRVKIDPKVIKNQPK